MVRGNSRVGGVLAEDDVHPELIVGDRLFSFGQYWQAKNIRG